MKALVFHGPGRIVIEDRDVPVPKAGSVLVRVKGVGICGSEMEAYNGSSSKRFPPLVLGHEIVGTVGEGTDLYAVNPLASCGSCSICRRGRPNLCPDRRLLSLHLDGGQAEFVAVPESSLTLLPGVVDATLGALVEPLAIVVNALSGLESVRGRQVAVIGCGSIGLMAVRLAHMWGADLVAAGELIDSRLRLAEAMGAVRLDTLKGQERFDIVLDMVGTTTTRRAAVELVVPGGTVRLVGLHSSASNMDFFDIIAREIRVEGVYAYSPEQFTTAADLVSTAPMGLETMVTQAPLTDGPIVFEMLTRDPRSMVKVVLRP